MKKSILILFTLFIFGACHAQKYCTPPFMLFTIVDSAGNNIVPDEVTATIMHQEYKTVNGTFITYDSVNNLDINYVDSGKALSQCVVSNRKSYYAVIGYGADVLNINIVYQAAFMRISLYFNASDDKTQSFANSHFFGGDPLDITQFLPVNATKNQIVFKPAMQYTGKFMGDAKGWDKSWSKLAY
ncbi:MAG TPA: hypothetical protein VK806_12990 [Bacteroidia bacterium]|nr:hypothetical protein [Bacteroidia bacterium]